MNDIIQDMTYNPDIATEFQAEYRCRACGKIQVGATIEVDSQEDLETKSRWLEERGPVALPCYCQLPLIREAYYVGVGRVK